MSILIKVPEEVVALIEKDPVAAYRVLAMLAPMSLESIAKLPMSQDQVDRFIYHALISMGGTYTPVEKEDMN